MKDKNCPLFLSTRGALAAACMLLPALAQAQPTISAISPDGSHQFQPASALTFNVASLVGVTNVSVQLTVGSLLGSKYLEAFSTGNGLSITGPSTSESVSVPLNTNVYYSVVIQATDANGATASSSAAFDTINPSYIFEAEDWDYSGGKFIDNPQTNQYAGLSSVSGTDDNNASPGSGNSSYRPQGMETEDAGDTPRLPYIGTTNVDYDVGYATGGGWANYTRHYPAGLYNIYARLADGNGATTDAEEVSVLASASGNANLIGAAPFGFNVQSTGWQSYRFYPLLDSTGSLVQFTNDGTQATLQMLTVGGNYNANFYMLFPAATGGTGAGPTITPIYPDGTVQFQATNSLNFSVQSSVGVAPNNVVVQLSGTNLVGKTTNVLYTTANGLTVSGSDTSFTVSVPLASNTIYNAFLQAVDENQNPTGISLSFDTITPFYTFEAEDYDYNGGLYHDNPQTNAYSGGDGEFHIDFYVDDPSSGSHNYRDNDNPTVGGPETEGCNDVPRLPFYNTGFADYDVGFNDPANWENYTRHYPAGTYNIFMRAANGGGGGGSCNMAMVTAGLGTSNQSTTNLGTFTIPPTGNWQAYVFCGLKDVNGNLIKVTFNGSPATLRATGPSSCNANFYMLQPADASLPITAIPRDEKPGNGLLILKGFQTL